MAADERGYARMNSDQNEPLVLAMAPTLTTSRRTWRQAVRVAVASRSYAAVGAVALTFALFAEPACVLLDLPDDPFGPEVDALMALVLLFFTADIALRCSVRSGYVWTLLFWMDVIGTASLSFGISCLLGASGHIQEIGAGDSQEAVRAIRLWRIAQRSGRLLPLLRAFSLFLDVLAVRASIAAPADTLISARRIETVVAQMLASKVALLTVLLVLGVPVLCVGYYPLDDFSVRFAGRKLEADYARAFHEGYDGSRRDVVAFEASVQDVIDFFADMEYWPYDLKGYDAVDPRLRASLRGPAPARLQSVVRQRVARCLFTRPGCDDTSRAWMDFDFSAVSRRAALMDICLIFAMGAFIGLQTWDFRRAVRALMLDPLEKLLKVAGSMSDVLKQATRKKTGLSEPEASGQLDAACCDASALAEDSAASLERISQRMARITSLFVEQNVVDEAQLEALDQETKGVFVDMMQYEIGVSRQRSQRGSLLFKDDNPTGLPAGVEDVMSWGLNLLSLDDQGALQVVNHVMFDTDAASAVRRWIDLDTFRVFSVRVRDGYNDHPYHMFAHGADVTVCTFRLLAQVQWQSWLSDVETVAVLVSALSHDVGHPGRTNAFLVEIGDALALRYNDTSPLENMHCARLFEICSDRAANVFQRFDKPHFRKARAAAIEGILHTDNAKHSDMVKAIKHFHEANFDRVETHCHEGGLSPQYLEEVISRDTMLWIKVVLHLADVSSPLKTFEMNRLWASRVIDELFAQGDEEKRLGIPVGMLNDRDKVSRSGCEHGFITFLVAPFVLSVVPVFPTLFPLASRMVDNMRQWNGAWIAEASPSEEDVKKREADIERIAGQACALNPKGRAKVSINVAALSPPAARPRV